MEDNYEIASRDARIEDLDLKVFKLECILREIKTLGERFPDPYIPGQTFAKMADSGLTVDGEGVK